jgi:signal transduction histidine kinase
MDMVLQTNNRTVLCIDDEREILSALQRSLRNVAGQVVTATNGEEGIALLEEHAPAVIISDMRMPGMNGAEFLQRVLEFAPHTFRILLTGHADIEAAISAINKGEIHRYMHKPWDSDELNQAIKQGFERHDLIQANLALTDSLGEKNRELQQLNGTLEEKVVERTQQLLHSERLSVLGRLAAGIVHEVMTPLTISVGWVETVAKAENITEDQRQSLSTATEQIFRAASIMESMRDFSRKKHPIKTSTDINKLIEHTLDLLIHPLRQKNIGVTRALDAQGLVEVDAEQISQVLLNLINNAIDALEPGGRITLSTRRIDSSLTERSIEVEVKDNGAGIAPDLLEQIFEPFFSTKGSNGTGLGLSICKGIIDNHEGQIRVDSRLGRGTTFTLSLPVTS